MAAYVKYQCFVEDMAEKKHNLGSDTCKIALTNTAPNVATHTTLADITDLTTANGYTAGGNAATVSTSAQTTGTYKLVLADPTTWTASGGTIGPFRYAVLYNDTSATDALIAYWDYGSSVTLQIGETFTVDLDGSGGVFTLA